MSTLENQPYHDLELLEVSALIQSRQISCVELTQSMFNRIEKLDGVLQSYVCLMKQSAMVSASHADNEISKGEWRGVLHGVPLAVKDMFWTKEAPTTAGMAIHLDTMSPDDATPIKRLRGAGATLLGKLVLTEGVYAEHTPPFKAPINPWGAEYWSGASSSGSAVAVAAGLCFGALGSETGGSIRLPSAANGVTGLKPTWGRVSRYGAFELAASMDHVGVLARSVADAAAILGEIAGPDILDPTAALRPVPDYLKSLGDSIEGLRIGLDWRWISSLADSITQKALLAAIDVLGTHGAKVVEVTVPDVRQMIDDWVKVCAVQTAFAHRHTFAQRSEEYGQGLRHLIEIGNKLSGLEYQGLLLRKADFTGRFEALFNDVDAIAMPVLPFSVPKLERMANIDLEMIAALHTFTCPFNMTGSPSITMPCGLGEGNTPLVFQLVGPQFAESTILNLGAVFQNNTQWHRRRPTLAFGETTTFGA
ncbi:amidase [Pseudomonas corrugata]|uniref:amidase n=1 Tax=Pseudomonas corrugata TaxID=47879 RepID=UPI0006D8ADFD|nr:amidase [Pseudomonas corrugata]